MHADDVDKRFENHVQAKCIFMKTKKKLIENKKKKIKRRISCLMCPVRRGFLQFIVCSSRYTLNTAVELGFDIIAISFVRINVSHIIV